MRKKTLLNAYKFYNPNAYKFYNHTQKPKKAEIIWPHISVWQVRTLTPSEGKGITQGNTASLKQS